MKDPKVLILIIKGLLKLIHQHVTEDEDIKTCKCIAWIEAAENAIKEWES